MKRNEEKERPSLLAGCAQSNPMQEKNMPATKKSSGKTYRGGIIGLTGIGQAPPRYNL